MINWYRKLKRSWELLFAFLAIKAQPDPIKRLYIRTNVVAFSLCLVLFFASVIGLVAPSTAAEANLTLAFPHWETVLVSFIAAFGSGLATIGIFNFQKEYESIGKYLVAISFLIQFLAVVQFSPSNWRTGLFLLGLAIGLHARAHFLREDSKEDKKALKKTLKRIRDDK